MESIEFILNQRIVTIRKTIVSFVRNVMRRTIEAREIDRYLDARELLSACASYDIPLEDVWVKTCYAMGWREDDHRATRLYNYILKIYK